jgi:hypothetical protein
MGFFKKTKDNFTAGQQNAAQAQAMVAANQAQQQAGAAQGKIGVQGMGAISADPAILGGPSTQPLAPDDPMLQPVNGVSLEMYAWLGKQAQLQGITDVDGMAALAEQTYSIPAADVKAAIDEWVARMGKSMVVGQQFRKHFDVL